MRHCPHCCRCPCGWLYSNGSSACSPSGSEIWWPHCKLQRCIRERTKAASSNIITKHGMKKEIGDRRACLHRGVVGCGASGHGFHVGISEACDLQILLFVHETGESCHQTDWRLRLKEHDAREHAKLWVKSFVHVELQSHFLDLIIRWKNIYDQFM